MHGGDAELARLVDRPASVAHVEELLTILLPPLAWIDALPEAYGSRYRLRAPPLTLSPIWSAVQHTLLTHILVTWGETLKDKGFYTVLLDGWFTPTQSGAERVWCDTLATCTEQLSAIRRAQGAAALHPLVREALVHILERLSTNELVQRLLCAVEGERRAPKRALMWSDSVAQLVGLPARVANVWEHSTPARLTQHAFLAHVARNWEAALTRDRAAWLAELLAKLVRAGYVTHDIHGCFWHEVLPAVVARATPNSPAFPLLYTQAWAAVFAHLGASAQGTLVFALARQLDVCLAKTHCAWPVALEEHSPGTEGRAFLSANAATARNAAYAILTLVAQGDMLEPLELVRIGPAYPSTTWSPLLCQALVPWMRFSALDVLVGYWADSERCARTSVKQEQMLTALLLLHTAGTDAKVRWTSLAHTPTFLQGVSAHLDHTDALVRRLGMLVAECVSAAAVSPEAAPLRFPTSVWDGRGEGREVCRVLRAMRDAFDWARVVAAPHTPEAWAAALQLDATPSPTAVACPPAATWTCKPPRAPLTTRRLPERVPPKAPAAASSAPRGPLIQVLDDPTSEFHTYASPMDHDVSSDEGQDSSDTEDDPSDPSGTLDAAFSKPLRAPVYIYELAPLAREREVRAQKMLLKHAEPLLRRKTGWGYEIAEQATDLCIALCALQDHYGLRAFEARRTAALTALCAACPDPVADCLFEQVFHPHYAVAQRVAMLHAAAYAAQELAGVPREDVERAATRLTDDAATHARETGEHKMAAADPVRHAARVRNDAVRAALSDAPLPFAPQGSVRPKVAYTTAALGAFLFPLLNRFWMYRQAHRQRRVLYTGSDVVLSPVVLNTLLQTLAVLCYYAQNAPHFYARLVPDVLEMVDSVLAGEQETLVAGAALSVALIVLQATLQAGQGLALVRGHAPLLARLQDTAQAHFAEQEMRAGTTAPTPDLLVSPGTRARRAAAAVVVQLAELQEATQKAFLEGGRI